MNKTTKKLLWIGAGIAAVAAANNAVFTRARAQGNPLGGEGRFWPGPYGDLFYARQGKGPVLLLVHGIYEGASSYEWRKSFDALSEHFNVYALDWLGFGLSDKPRIRYTAAGYVEQLRQFIREVIKEPVAIVASSLGAAYAIRAAAEEPDLVKSLILVCPTGMRRQSDTPKPLNEAIYRVLSAPLIGTTIHNLLTSAPSLRCYLMNQTYFDPSFVDEDLVEHYSTAAHQYGSQNAPPAFLSRLLSHSVADVFPSLPQEKIRIVWGREARMTPLADAEAFLAANSRAELTVLDKAGLLPQDEQAHAFNRLVVETLTDTPAHKPKARARKHKEEEEHEE
jgi:pimeloyl-ACP methyl ester carboxylesterase